MKQKQIGASMQKRIKNRQLLVAAGVDTPEEEQWCKEAGCEFVLIYPTARYKNIKNRFLAGFLAFGNTNAEMESIAQQWMSVMKGKMLFAGVNGSDPFKNDRLLLGQLKKAGFAGIHNYPPMSLVDGQFGNNLENLKEGLEKEIQIMKKAKKIGLLTCCMVSGKKQAVRVAREGVDIIVLYPCIGEALEGEKAVVVRYIKKLKEISEAVQQTSFCGPLFFAGEHITTVEEVEEIVRQVKLINGYLLLPMMRQKVSKNQIYLEVRKLHNIIY